MSTEYRVRSLVIAHCLYLQRTHPESSESSEGAEAEQEKKTKKKKQKKHKKHKSSETGSEVSLKCVYVGSLHGVCVCVCVCVYVCVGL